MTEEGRPQKFRVTVRGVFQGLAADQRAALLAGAAAHDVLFVGRFSKDGTFTYGRDLFAFTFGFDLAASGPDAETDVATEAEVRAMDRLEAGAWGYRNLRTSVSRVPEPRRR
jgi:hypothetical protein